MAVGDFFTMRKSSGTNGIKTTTEGDRLRNCLLFIFIFYCLFEPSSLVQEDVPGVDDIAHYGGSTIGLFTPSWLLSRNPISVAIKNNSIGQFFLFSPAPPETSKGATQTPEAKWGSVDGLKDLTNLQTVDLRRCRPFARPACPGSRISGNAENSTSAVPSPHGLP